MCIVAAPIALALASTVTSAAAVGLQYAGQAQAASSAARYGNQRYSETAKNALESYRFNLNQLDLRSAQETQAASQAAVQVAREGAAGRASANVSAAARGVAGNSVEALIHEFSAIESEDLGTIRTNLNWRQADLKSQAKSLHADTQSRIASATPAPVNGPSPFGLALGLAGAGVQGATDYYQMLKIR